MGTFYNKGIKFGVCGKSKQFKFFDIFIIDLRCSLLVFALYLLQSVKPRIYIVFLQYILHYILVIGNIEMNPGPLNESNLSNISNNVLSREDHIFILSINIRSIRKKYRIPQ